MRDLLRGWGDRMNILSKVTWQAMWKNKIRTIVTIIGVVLSAALFMAVATMVYSLWDFMVRGGTCERGDFYIEFDGATDEQYRSLVKDRRVELASDFQMFGYITSGDSSPGGTVCFGAVDAQFLRSMPIRLKAGRLPQNSREIAIPGLLIRGWRNHQVIEGDILGQTITLTVYEAAAGGEVLLEREYTVVGELEGFPPLRISGDVPPYRYGFTLADGEQGDCQSHILFVKTHNPYAVLAMMREDHGSSAHLNYGILEYYGISNYNSSYIDEFSLAIALILCAIIMLASVSLIRNAFAISISERTKQFGLLISVGATKKQIRKSVRTEAWVVGFIGIPLGLLLGYAGVAAILAQVKYPIMDLFSFSENGDVKFYITVSWVSVAVTVLIGFATIFLSVWIPSERAVRVSPLEAIRQTQDYKATARTVRVSPIVKMLFGLSGVLGTKYYKVSKKKYRSTVISLTISIVLFVLAGQFFRGMSLSLDSRDVENFDFSISVSGEGRDAVIEKLRGQDGVEQSALVLRQTVGTVVEKDAFDPMYLKAYMTADFLETNWRQKYVGLVYLEDSVLKAHLIAEGIDPAPYFDPDHPVALRIPQSFRVTEDVDGEWVQKTYYGSAIKASVTDILLCSVNLPDGLASGTAFWHVEATEAGEPLFVCYDCAVTDTGVMEVVESSMKYYVAVATEERDGYLTVYNYYSYDVKTQTRGNEILASEAVFAPELGLGAVLKDRPFGVGRDRGGDFMLILPLSAAPEALRQSEQVELQIKAADYAAVRESIEACRDGELSLTCHDYGAYQRNARGLIEILKVFSACFVALIAMIASANVFTTISTNIALRQRDFAMLRSMGLKPGALYKLVVFECLNYGGKALLWSMPISIIVAYLCHGAFQSAYYVDFAIPWKDLFIGTIIVLGVVFITMFYAVSKLRKDTPIEAIRMENL